MAKPKPLYALLSALILVCFAGSGTVLAHGDSGQHPSMTKKAGDYTVKLVLLPPEPFVSQSKAGQSANAGEMVNGGGAPPNAKSGAEKPNHHLVAFIKKNGKPVEDAHVKMSYQTGTHKKEGGASVVTVPVTRMWVAGKGKKTTHYGNNVDIKPGKYRVHMVINHDTTVNFPLTVKQ